MKKTAAILLAAGLSSRTTHPKQLFDINGKSLVQFQIELLLEAKITTVYVVVGYHSDRVIESISSDERVRIVHNFTPENGMFSSLKRGIEALDSAEERILIHPIDVPITPFIGSLLQAEGAIVIPRHSGRNGHPVLVNRELLRSIVTKPQQRLDRWLEHHRTLTSYVEIADPHILLNANTDDELSDFFKEGT